MSGTTRGPPGWADPLPGALPVPDPPRAPDAPGTAPHAPEVPGIALHAPDVLDVPDVPAGVGGRAGGVAGRAGGVAGRAGGVGGCPSVPAAEAKRSSRESAATEGPVSPLSSSYNCRHQSSS
ncbi:hypothetical protein [Streptomyces sp. NPDC012510]|uniref:hypothetical protein n=1 Tax=Streptomyces sp. NPDC012510 TaxID=3364838 RepID=UPI0036E67FF4